MPICLPSGPRFPDSKGVVYVAGTNSNQNSQVNFQKKSKFIGWGSTNDQDCTTNDDGPDPYSLCKFPFLKGGLLHTECLPSTSPSGNNKVCVRMSEQVTKDHRKFPPPGYSRVCIYI